MSENEDWSHNCCQKTLAACRGDRLDLETAYRLGSYFGWGMHRYEACGAVVGGLLALGLKYGDDNSASEIYEKFLTEFENKFGSLRCGELNKDYCGEFIRSATDMVNKLINEGQPCG